MSSNLFVPEYNWDENVPHAHQYLQPCIKSFLRDYVSQFQCSSPGDLPVRL